MTGDQEVMGSIPAMSGNILSWRFSTVSLSVPLIQEGQLSVSVKRMCTNTSLIAKRTARKSVVR